MTNIVEFPLSDRPFTEAEIDKLHSEAFRNLEGEICDCLRMCEIVVKVMPDDTDEHLMFAVLQNIKMMERFKEHYYALWHGEK